MNEDLAAAIEHTLLRATATPDEIRRLCAEARIHGFCGVCVNPRFVALAARELADVPPRVVTVVAFPLGASVPEVAAFEAQRAIADGADELDLVIPIGEALGGDLEAVARAVGTVREATRGATLKVILETGCFTESQLDAVARAALCAAPDFLKTSTGFGPRGASVEDVRTLVALGAGRTQVKAAGGIRSAADARALLAAGATRLGTSSGVALVAGR